MALTLVPVPDADRAPDDGRREAEHPPAWRLAACSPERAADMLALLADDYLTTQVFLDFGRLFRPGRSRFGALERILLADLERHTRFLPASLERIAAAFTAAGGRGPLFVLSGGDALLLHPLTRLAVATICRAARAAPALRALAA